MEVVASPNIMGIVGSRAITVCSALFPLQGSAGQQVADLYSNPWDGVILGRIDSDVVGPNKVPAVDAPVEEIRVSKEPSARSR